MFNDLCILIQLEPGSPAVFGHDAVYNARVDLSWKPPCEPNGEIIDYEIEYGGVVTSQRKKVVVGGEKESLKVTGLAMLTSYSFQIRARNSMGYGPPKTFVVKTKGPAGKKRDLKSDLDSVQKSVLCFSAWSKGRNRRFLQAGYLRPFLTTNESAFRCVECFLLTIICKKKSTTLPDCLSVFSQYEGPA